MGAASAPSTRSSGAHTLVHTSATGATWDFAVEGKHSARWPHSAPWCVAVAYHVARCAASYNAARCSSVPWVAAWHVVLLPRADHDLLVTSVGLL